MDRQRLSAFINAFDTDRDPLLTQLELESISQGIPIIRHEMISFLQVILKIVKPGRILEVGTATGFSALVMAAYSDPSCHIVTIEKDPDRITAAREHFSGTDMADRIRLIPGDAQEVLEMLANDPEHACGYDMVFMDAAKAQYIHFLPLVKRLMKPGAIMISDNVLQEGNLLESKYLIPRRDRTIYKRMRDYLYALKHDPALITSILPLGDGVALSYLREDSQAIG